MRRGLAPDDLGDLFDLPLSVVLSLTLPTGAVISRPIWHRFVDGRFRFQFPDGDRKIALLERDPAATALLAENAFPYRAIEVRGQIRMTRTGYRELGADVCRRYVEAYDPAAAVEDYLSAEPGVIADLEPVVTTCWDYADDAMMPPTVS